MFDPTAPVEAYQRPTSVPAGQARCAACGRVGPEEEARCCVTVDWGRHYEEMLCAACYDREVDDE